VRLTVRAVCLNCFREAAAIDDVPIAVSSVGVRETPFAVDLPQGTVVSVQAPEEFGVPVGGEVVNVRFQEWRVGPTFDTSASLTELNPVAGPVNETMTIYATFAVEGVF